MLKTGPLAFFLLSVMTMLPTAWAASVDPELEWKTLKTEHFNITYHQGEKQLATDLAQTAERVHSILTVDMKHAPDRPTEVVLMDHTDIANGYAQTLPVNTIVIFVTAPTEISSLGLYEDWLEAIFTHEYAHILHLDTVTGIPKLLRKIMGRIISVNQISPWWIVEGFATYQETRFTTGGRGRAPAAQMMIRMAILEDMFPELGQLDGWISDPPGGNLRYLFGQSFLQYIADHSSEDIWTRWIHSYGGWIPWVLPAKQVLGKSFETFYAQWKAALENEYQTLKAQLEEDGLTAFDVVSDGEDVCYGPAYSPSGDQLVFSCSDRAEGSSILSLEAEAEEPKTLLENHFAKAVRWRSDGKAFVFSTPHSVGFYNLYEDIYFHEIGSKSAKALTSAKRARDPVFSPNGSELIMIRNKAQDNNLFRMRIDQSLEALTNHSDHTQYSTPVFSPNGRFIALSKWQSGYRDIWIYDDSGQPYRRLTADTHIDRDPAFSADGKTLFFSSDRTGIPNLFAYDLETEELWQVTNVLGGAFQPSPHPSGDTIAFQSYSTNGHDIAVMDWKKEDWRSAGATHRDRIYRGVLSAVFDPQPPPTPSAPPSSEVEQDSKAPLQVSDPASQDFTITDYSPIPSLFPPRFVMPGIYQGGFGFMGVLMTGGADTLRQYGYSGYLTYRTDAKYLGGGAGVTINRWRPIMSAGASTYAVPYGDIYVESPSGVGPNIPGIESARIRYWDKRVRGYAALAYPIRNNFAVYGRWVGTNRSPLNGIPDSAYRPFLPTRGFVSQLAGGVRWVRGGSNTYSISPEGARVISLNAKLTPSWLGSYTLQYINEEDQKTPFDQLQVTAEIRDYVDVPYFANHVLALRAAGGASFGDNFRYGSFRLGGNYGESAYYVLADEIISLRGWPIAAISGDWYYLASAEYRFPIWRIDRGIQTLPIFFRNFHGAVFVDLGSAFDEPETPELPHLGTGAELRFNTILGWGALIQTRAGYAFSLYPNGGIQPTSPESWYFRLGTSF